MIAARFGAAAGIWGAVSAAGAGDWTMVAAFAVPAIGMTLLGLPARGTAR